MDEVVASPCSLQPPRPVRVGPGGNCVGGGCGEGCTEVDQPGTLTLGRNLLQRPGRTLQQGLHFVRGDVGTLVDDERGSASDDG